MAWNTRTNLRALETTTQLVVEICHQMEGWRRLLRYLDRVESERAEENTPLIGRIPKQSAAA